MAQIHPKWGRPFEQYIESFKIEITKKRIRWQHDFELEEARREAAEVTRKMYKIAGESKNIDSQNLGSYITLPMLKSIEKLSRSPITLVDFSNTALISGCVKLMHAASKTLRQTSKSSSLFSYEYGYLCLRIITITVGVCLLQRAGRLPKLLAEMASDRETDIVFTLSQHVSELIQDELHKSEDGSHFDWILGWAKSSQRPLQEPFALRSDMWTLLNLLYDGRKHFLSIFASTYSLGLSGLMTLLWRYHKFDCRVNSSDSHTPEDFIPIYGDILLRYFLVAPTRHIISLTSVFGQTRDITILRNPQFVDVEDSKAIFDACAKCFAPADTALYEPLPLAGFSVYLFCIKPLLRPGCEHLLPPLFRATIQRFWKALLGGDENISVLVDVMKDAFEFFRQFIEFLKPKTNSNQAVLAQIVQDLAEDDFVELTLRVMLMLDMDVDTSSPEFVVNGQYVAFSSNFFYTLGQVAPAELLRTGFAYLAPGLARYALFLRWRHTLKGLTEGEVIVIRVAERAFARIVPALRQEGNMDEFLRPPGACSYSRCPYPRGARHACGICTCSLYCDVRCQSADWKGKSSWDSHRALCPGDLKTMNPIQLFETLSAYGHAMATDENGVPVDMRTILGL